MPVIARMFAELPEKTLACLQIAGDERRFPFRPLAVGQHRIGSSPDCEIRLGEQGIPDLHSVICVGTATAEITAVAGSPPLLRNGEPCSAAILEHGDLIEVGELRTVFLRVNSSASAACPADAAGVTEKKPGFAAPIVPPISRVAGGWSNESTMHPGVPTQLLDEILRQQQDRSLSLRIPERADDNQRLQRPA